MTKAELKRSGLVDLSKNLRQHSFQAVELLWLAALDKGYSENQEKKVEEKDVRHTALVKKRDEFKAEDKKKLLLLPRFKKKKPSCFHWSNKKKASKREREMMMMMDFQELTLIDDSR